MVAAMDLRGLAVIRSLFIALVLCGVFASPAQAQTSTAPVYDGQILVIQGSFVILTTGDAVRVAPDAALEGTTAKPGAFVRITLDPKTKLVVRLVVAAHAFAGGTNVTVIPRDYVAVDPRSARKPGSLATTGNGQVVQVTIVVEVPSNTPTGDVVYFSSDRSNYSVSETRMDQIDALHWSLVLPLVDGTTFHYKFTRGSYSTTERDRAGADVAARTLVAHKDLKTNDTVLRWADLR